MTREQFEQRAIRNAELRLYLPRGWWGNWGDVRGPDGERVRNSGSRWIASRDGKQRSVHDSRDAAIRKAQKL